MGVTYEQYAWTLNCCLENGEFERDAEYLKNCLKFKLWTLLTILCLLGKLESRWQSDRYAYGML